MGLALRPYQEQAADFLYEHDRAMILAPVGAGKTAITLTALRDMLQDGYIKRALVLAPKRVCTDVWPVETPKWAPELRLGVCNGTPKKREAVLKDKTRNVVVSNYENLQWLALQSLDFDLIVFDELTRLKNPSGARFKALNKVIDRIPYRWGLTGSFTSNGLEDVFGQCKIIDQSLLGRAKGAFLQQYFICLSKEYNDWTPRPNALEQVMERIRPATFVLEPGVYKEKLPDLNVVEMRVDLPDRAPYETMKKSFVLDDITAVNAAVVTAKLQQIASGFAYTDSGDSAWFSHHKYDLLDEIIDGNQRANTLVVYNYKEELAELKRRYPKAKTLDDAHAIEHWNAGHIEMLLVHPKSAGHGLNLQYGGHHVVFMSLPWSLELYEQTIGRLHRGGQKYDVWCYILLSNKTIDEKIWAALHDKRAVSDIAMAELKQ
jgi:SNF2 family DNA or RNA helicase